MFKKSLILVVFLVSSLGFAQNSLAAITSCQSGDYYDILSGKPCSVLNSGVTDSNDTQTQLSAADKFILDLQNDILILNAEIAGLTKTPNKFSNSTSIVSPDQINSIINNITSQRNNLLKQIQLMSSYGKTYYTNSGSVYTQTQAQNDLDKIEERIRELEVDWQDAIFGEDLLFPAAINN